MLSGTLSCVLHSALWGENCTAVASAPGEPLDLTLTLALTLTLTLPVTLTRILTLTVTLYRTLTLHVTRNVAWALL